MWLRSCRRVAASRRARSRGRLVAAAGRCGVCGPHLWPAGLLLGVALSWPLVTHGLDYSDMLGSESFETAGVVISSTLFATWDVGGMAAWTLAAWLMTILSTLWPAWTAARLSPVDAMRHV